MNLKQIIENNGEDTILNLYGIEFKLTSEKKIYSQIYDKYKKIALEVATDFQKTYTASYDATRDIEIVQNDVVDKFVTSIQPLINEIRVDLASIKRYDYTVESIVEDLTNHDYFKKFQSVYSNLCVQINGINTQLNREIEYREYRKENRGRWEVTTFGGTWKDAIKNQIQVEAMNALSGLGHSLVNSAGNSMSEAVAQSKKERLYNEDLKKEFVEAVYFDCISVHVFLVKILSEQNCEMEKSIVTDVDKEKASKILKNYKTMDTDDNTALDMLQEAIKINPFDINVYKEIVERFGDAHNSVEKYGEHHNIDIRPIKRKLAVCKCKEKLDKITDEEELKDKTEELIQIVHSYGLVYEETEVQELYNNKALELDLKFRTVDGIVFEERKDAKIARKELDEIIRLISDIGTPRYLDSTYEDSLKSAFEKISTFTTDVKNRYIKQINDLIKEYDLNYKNVDTIIFETREEADLARQEKVKIESMIPDLSVRIQRIDELYENNLIEIKNIISQFKTEIKNQYILAIDRVLKEYDIFYRTVKYYLNEEVVFQTRKDADVARRELDSILKLIDGVNPPDKNSMLDYEEIIKEKLSILQTNYSTMVVGKYIELLQRYLTDFYTIFRKVSLFSSSSVEEAAQKRLKKEMSHLKYDSWEDVDNAKLLLSELTIKLKIDRSTAIEYEQIIKNNENRLKTIDGLYFETREAADMARDEFNRIQDLLSDVRPPKKSDLLDYEWKIKGKIERLNAGYKTVIKKKYIELLNKYLSGFEETFCQISMLKKGTRVEAAKEKAVKFVKEYKLVSIMDIETVRSKLIELLPKLGLQRNDIVEAEQYLEQKKNEIINGVPSSNGLGKFGKFFKK